MSGEALMEWVRQHAGDAPVQLRATREDAPEGVSLVLVGLDPVASFASSRFRIELTYRLTVRLADAADADDLLCRLTFAALEAPELPATGDVRQGSINLLAPAEARTRHGPLAEPCLHLVVTVERQQDITPARPVIERVLNSSQTVPRLSAGREG